MTTTLPPSLRMQHLWPVADKVEHARRNLQEGRKQRTFAEWLPVVTPEYQWNARHLQPILNAFQRMIDGDLDKLMVFLPPRHGKSEALTVRGAAYVIEQHPNTSVIVAAHTHMLAQTFSRKTRRIVSDRVGLSSERSATEEWETQNGSVYRAVGIGGPITGTGGDWIFIDDPVKSREQADSQTYRDRAWEWFTDDLMTRRAPDAKMTLIMCMTGDTPVLMADGTERLLRDIKIGDRVATYDNGKLSTSTIQNHRSNGLDSVFKIKTICGKIVIANERHPFLVEEHGQLKWIRLRNLTTAHKIVTVKDSGVSGKGRHAALKAATNPLARGAIASPTMAKSGGLMGIVHPHTIRSLDATYALNIDTESLPLSTMPCSQHKMGSAPFANSHLATTCVPTGAVNSVSTIATKPTSSEGSCVTTATLQLDMPKHKQLHSPLPNTSDFITTQIESIEPAGVEEVFDVQVERTENFIANGLVSHNTRWHMDDLAGRILENDGPAWHAIHLPAIALEDDPLERDPGESLWPERYPPEFFADIQAQNPRTFAALYQGMPQPEGGAVFIRDWWDGRNRYDSRDTSFKPVARVIFWDTAEEDNDQAAYTVGVVAELGTDYRLRVVDVVRKRVAFPDLVTLITDTAVNHNRDGKLRGVEIEYASSGRQAFQTIMAQSPQWLRQLMRRYSPRSSKELRAQSAAAWCQNGMVLLPMPDASVPWLYDFERELYDFPTGKYKDQVDAFSGLVNRRKNELTMGYRQRTRPVNEAEELAHVAD